MNKPNYNAEIQRLYLEMFLSDAETFVRCQSIFNPDNFDKRYQETAEFITKYVDQYKIMPEVSIINASCNTDFETVVLPRQNYDWLMNEFENFSRHKSLERAILKSADMLENGEYNPVEKLIKDAIQISLNKDMGTDYWADPKSRLQRMRENNGQISTGYPSIDKKLYGGFKRGELNIFAAGSGGGKSLFLANLGVNFALAGLNVIYFTFELSEDLVSMRIDSMVSGIAAREIFKNLDDVEMKVKLTGKKSGGIQIKYLPSGKNCNDLRSYLKEYQVTTGKRPDILIVDYLDLMMPLSVKVSPSDMFVKDKYVSEELRNLAMETEAVVVTAAQLNRAAVEEVEFDHSHISGGLSKIQTADNVIGIFTSRSMREHGRYQIQFMKTRSSSGVGQKLDLEFDIDTLRIKDLGDEEEYSFASQRNSASSSLINGLKKTSVVTSTNVDPETGEIDLTKGVAVSKNKISIKPRDIRDILGTLNPEKD
jgi:KaiC/GvpD/RAD55 family RecA-like ATPase